MNEPNVNPDQPVSTNKEAEAAKDTGTQTQTSRPATPKPSFESARDRIRQRYSDMNKEESKEEPEKQAAEDGADPNAETENPEENGDEAKKDGDEENPEVELDHEELDRQAKEILERRRKEREERERAASTFKTFTETVLPETRAYAKERYERLVQMQKLAEQASAAASVTADTPEEGATGDVSKDILRPVKIDERTLRTIRQAGQEDWKPEYMSRKTLEAYSIDPDKVPEKYARAFEGIISAHNKLAASANFLNSESRKAFESRDTVKQELFKRDYENALEKNGYKVSDAARELSGKVREHMAQNNRLGRNSVPQGWAETLQEMSARFPEVFQKVQNAVAKGSKGEQQQQAANPENPPIGTRTARKQPETPAAKPPAKNYGEAANRVRERFAAMQNK